ncbi:hypothetical protein E4U21_000192 [Claviceps maximensis]|nr:hypothetical protein E4U21_000192 [Claviceps maximensis]
MDAGTSMAYAQLGQESPVCSSSLVVAEEDLFEEIFDWRRYCESTRELDMDPFHFPGHQTPRPQSLLKLKTHLPPTSLDLDTLAINHLHSDFGKMSSRYPSDDDTATISDYSGHSPPELIREGGSTSPSDHSGSVFLDHSEERTISVDIALHEAQEQHDNGWTYSPQTIIDTAKVTHDDYPPHLVIQEEYVDLVEAQSAGTKRRRSIKDIEKRPRQLFDPLQTADVRKSGACVPCRVTKTRVRHYHASLHK